jgi:hypothetical protein
VTEKKDPCLTQRQRLTTEIEKLKAKGSDALAARRGGGQRYADLRYAMRELRRCRGQR